jgi:putative molybdopterin biosynthesis protein
VDFLALQNEQYDMVIKKEDFESPMVVGILDILRSKEFQAQFQYMRGYDIKGMGTVVGET